MLPLIYHPIYSDFPLPEEHRYPLQKYRLLKEHIDKQCWPVEYHLPSSIDWQLLCEQHAPEYVTALINGTLPLVKMRRIGFPWSEALIRRSLTSLGGTLLTVDKALEHGCAVHLTGGYHHSHFDFGSGFCLFNDLFLAARHALTKPDIERVMIIDCDVHHGDGTATLAADHNDIITFSVHCDKNFPSRKPSSDMDLPLPRNTDDADYLSQFIPAVTLAVHQYQPDMIIYDAGVDIHIDDELGYFSVSQGGIRKRDDAVMALCKDHQIPVASVIGGGYRTDQSTLIPLHAELVRSALSIFHSHQTE